MVRTMPPPRHHQASFPQSQSPFSTSRTPDTTCPSLSTSISPDPSESPSSSPTAPSTSPARRSPFSRSISRLGKLLGGTPKSDPPPLPDTTTSSNPTPSQTPDHHRHKSASDPPYLEPEFTFTPPLGSSTTSLSYPFISSGPALTRPNTNLSQGPRYPQYSKGDSSRHGSRSLPSGGWSEAEGRRESVGRAERRKLCDDLWS
ncbi:hypothetical protein BDV98DRAFT_130533 [Pterulicium gracile]|uniref:Uncharacterized protein n=1 Tax=Pterulicium gracile TaxID=1884261 RepID=A0A5C3QD80_9AGAR|nr:hypothetical protein BDV98DRAFT_130533 [Pterula gracilis]